MTGKEMLNCLRQIQGEHYNENPNALNISDICDGVDEYIEELERYLFYATMALEDIASGTDFCYFCKQYSSCVKNDRKNCWNFVWEHQDEWGDED